MTPFTFLTEKSPLTREDVIEVVTTNMILLYDGRFNEHEIQNMIELVCINLNIR